MTFPTLLVVLFLAFVFVGLLLEVLLVLLPTIALGVAAWLAFRNRAILAKCLGDLRDRFIGSEPRSPD